MNSHQLSHGMEDGQERGGGGVVSPALLIKRPPLHFNGHGAPIKNPESEEAFS